MQKVSGVESVRVSLNEGLTVLELKTGNSVTLTALRSIIKNNGFVSKDAVVVARGVVSAARLFEVTGTGEQLPVTGQPVATGAGEWRLTSPAK